MSLNNILIDPEAMRRNQANTTTNLDITTVLSCKPCKLIMLRRDLIKGKCPRCDRDVDDITGSPLARSWLEIVKPSKKEKKGGKDNEGNA